MPVRTIIEWRCARCGDEEAIPSGKPHGWRSTGGLSGYQGNPKPASPEPHASGDICPQCAASFLAWWQRRDQPPVAARKRTTA